MAAKNYVQLVNDAIDESGADLAKYEEDGSDFYTNTDSLMNKFKKWVARAWKTIQQEADDWEFLTSRAVVNTGPGIMFYTQGVIPGTVPPEIDIYDANGDVKIEGVAVKSMVDLTGGYTSNDNTKSYGYIKVGDASTPVDFTLKPGNDYFYLNGRLTRYSRGTNLNLFYNRGIAPGAVMSAIISIEGSPTTYSAFSNSVTLEDMQPFTESVSRGTTSFAFTTSNRQLNRLIEAAIDSSTPYTVDLFQLPVDVLTPFEYLTNVDPDNPPIASISYNSSGISIEVVDSKAYVHGWRSFDWNEELGEDDFTDKVKEVNQATYKIISRETVDAGNSVPLKCVPWQYFLEDMATSQYRTGEPRIIAEDSQGRWQLWPHPKELCTITFDYTRTPQALKIHLDRPQHLPAEYEDLIMWKALEYYGKYDQQPDVVARARQEYANIAYRFEKQKRPKFVFRPAFFG